MASRRRIPWQFGILAAAAIVLVLVVVLSHRRREKPAPRPVPVEAATVVVQDMPLTISALGAAQAWTSDAVFSQVSGKLLRVNFAEGANVRAGQVLAEVDPAPYRAALTQAEGALARDQAILAGARLNLARYQLLSRQDSVARQTLDDQTAMVRQDEGTVELDRGAVAAAKVNLGWTLIRSPISGRAGVRLVDPGNLVSAGGSQPSAPATAAATNDSAAPGAASQTTPGGIVVINQIRPIAVTFTVPQGEFQRLADASNGFRKPLSLVAHSQENGAVLGEGELRVADNKVDAATGTVELKARFANLSERLWPGQFVNVVLTLTTLHHALTVPQTAINRGPDGQFAFVVGPSAKVAMRPVAVASIQGGTAVVSAGLRPGETVVTDGQMILKAGSLVRVVRREGARG